MQVTDWLAVGEAGEQLTLSITGAWTAVAAATVNGTDPVWLPAAFLTVSDTV